MKIYNYPVKDEMTLNLRAGARVISIMTKENQPYIWVEIPDEGEIEERKFQIFGTGWPINDEVSYVGSYVEDDYFVWHLYEVIQK